MFFYNDTATTEIYPLSLHDALPIWRRATARGGDWGEGATGSPSKEAGRECTRIDVNENKRPDSGYSRFTCGPSPSLSEIGRAHDWTPVTIRTLMPTSA